MEQKYRVWFYHRKACLIGRLELFQGIIGVRCEKESGNNLCKFSKAFQGSNPKGIHLCVCFPIRWRRNAYSQSHIGLETGSRCWLSTVTSLEEFFFFFFQIFLMSFWGIGGTGGNLISYFYINGVKGCVYSVKVFGIMK